MKNWLKIALYACFLLVGQVSIAKDTATIYTLPFNIVTYVPITKSMIRTSASEKWVIADQVRVRHLLEILHSGTPHLFEDANVRAVVYYGHDSFFITQDGDVENNTNSTKIDVSKFLKFYSTLRDDEKRSVHE